MPRETSAAIGELFRGFSGYVQADAKSVYDLLFKPAAERPPLDDGEPDLDERHEVGCWSHCRRKAWEVAITSKDPVAREAVLRIKRIFDLDRSWRGKRCWALPRRPPAALAAPDGAALWFPRRPRGAGMTGGGQGGRGNGPRNVPSASYVLEQIATALRLMVGGDQEVSRFHDPFLDQDYDVQLRLSQADRSDPRTISRLYVSRSSSAAATSLGAPAQVGMAPGGGLVRLDSLVKIAPGPDGVPDRPVRAPARESSARGHPAGYGQADRMDALRQATAEMNLPAGYTTAVSGRAREFERTFAEFLWVFLLAVIFMYMILASQFESLLNPLNILLSLPLAIPFALFSLWYTGNTLNLYSALGILVLFGVVKKNSILQVDHMNALRREGYDRRTAILQGNRDRLRPILMTTLALVGGMLPLWVGTGPGSEERRAIAVVVIGGQTLSLLLTLLVTPVAYLWLDDLVRLLRWRPRARAEQAAVAIQGAADDPAPVTPVAGHVTAARNGPTGANGIVSGDGDGVRPAAPPRELKAHPP